MPNTRVTKVTLQAEVNNYIAGMARAADATKKFGSESEKLAQQKQSITTLGSAFAAVGGAAAVGVGAAVVEFTKFSAQMAQVQTLAHATQGQMTQLSNAALTMGQGIGFSASEVADAEAELVKAGVSVQNIMGGGLKGALDLAAAGQINVADATSIAASALTQFGLKGSDVPHVADLLAAGADKALGGVTQLGQALSQSGQVAHQFGLTVDDTVGTLAEFAQNGILGSDAGTSLKQMFLQLASPSKQAQEAMSKVGFSAYDAQGKFIGITKLAGELHDKFDGMSDAAKNSALSIIFGSDAIRTASILVKDGAKTNQDWIKSVDDTGFAATQAAGKMNSLEGDVKKLESAFQNDLIKAGSGANGVLRGLVQNLTGVVSLVGSVPQPVADIGLAFGAVTAAVGLTGGAFLLLVPKMAEVKTAMSTLNVSAGQLGTKFGKGSAITLGLGVLVQGLAGMNNTASLTADQLSNLNAAAQLPGIKGLNKVFTTDPGDFQTFMNGTKGIKGALDEISSFGGQANLKVANAVDAITFHLTGLGDTGNRLTAQFAQLGTSLSETAKTSLPQASEEFRKLVNAAGGGSDAAKKLLDLMPDYKAQLIDLASAQGKTVSGQQLLNLAQGKGELATEIAAAGAAKQQAALDKLAGTATTAKGDISDLEDAIKNFGKTQFDVDSATRSVYDAIDTFTKSLKDNGKTLDVTTQKGRDNQQALEDIASSYLDLTSATLTQTGSTEKAKDAVTAGRAEFVKQAEAIGQTAAQANDYADRLGLIPANVRTAVTATGVETTNDALSKTKKAVESIPDQKRTQLVADKIAAERNLDSLQAKLITVPAEKKTKLEAEVAAALAKVRDLNRQIIAVPTSKTTTLNVNTSAATAQANALKSLIAGIDGASPQLGPSTAAALNAAKKKAGGGYITGPGTSTSDSIPAMLSDGEYVIKASAVDRIGVSTLNQLNNGYKDGGLIGLASGGSVSKAAAAAAKKRAAQQATLAKQLAKVNSDQFSFLSDVARGNLTGEDAVNSLYQVASQQTGGQQINLLHTALAFDKTLGKLTKSSDAASQKLSDLQSSASNLKQSVSSAVGATNVSSARSATGLSNLLTREAGQTHEFASLLHQLAQKGVAPALLSDIANMGTVQGLPLARSLAQSSTASIKSINANYKAIGSYGDYAGQVVSDANYKAQIAAADKNARSLEAQIAKQSLALQKVIGHALKVPGYSTGGYTGPARVTDVAGVVHGQEFVVNARATAANRAQLERMNAGLPGYASGGYVRTPVYVRAGESGAAPIDYDKLAAAMRNGAPKQFNQTFHLAPTDPVALSQAIARRTKMLAG